MAIRPWVALTLAAGRQVGPPLRGMLNNKPVGRSAGRPCTADWRRAAGGSGGGGKRACPQSALPCSPAAVLICCASLVARRAANLAHAQTLTARTPPCSTPGRPAPVVRGHRACGSSSEVLQAPAARASGRAECEAPSAPRPPAGRWASASRRWLQALRRPIAVPHRGLASGGVPAFAACRHFDPSASLIAPIWDATAPRHCHHSSDRAGEPPAAPAARPLPIPLPAFERPPCSASKQLCTAGASSAGLQSSCCPCDTRRRSPAGGPATGSRRAPAWREPPRRWR